MKRGVKDIDFDTEATERLKSGVDQLAQAVKVTLGPKGRNVAIERGNVGPHITKDGVTVAKEIHLDDQIANMGAQMVKEVAMKTVDEAGDGTTTSIVLAQAILAEGLKNVAAGANPIDVKRGIEKATKIAINELKNMAKEVEFTMEGLSQVATISANNDKTTGDIVAEAIFKTGKEGKVDIDEATGTETTIEIVDGTS